MQKGFEKGRPEEHKHREREREMAGTRLLIALAVVASILATTEAATSHIVGGSTGWVLPPNATFYSQWVASETFAVGDTLTFNFPTGEHDVIEVPKSSYDACSAMNQMGPNITTGPANVSITSPGSHYYICGVTSHCSTGQKLVINVDSGSSSGPAPPPTAGSPPGNQTPSSAPSSLLRSSAIAALLSATAAFLL